MPTFRIAPRGPFSLAESARFLGSFVPASGTAASSGATLTLAFRLDRTFAPVGVALAQAADGVVTGDVIGTDDADAASAQVARMLGLDVDATGFVALGDRDPVIGRMLAAYPGFRPVCFPSPWEAAVWGILAQRVPMRMAASIRAGVATAHGDRVRIGQEDRAIFPSPATVLTLDAASGVPAEKWARIRGIAEAALEGRLDAARLRAMEPTFALTELGSLRGVGAWTAGHILLRGAATVDVDGLEEPRVRHAVATAYGVPEEEDAIRRIVDAWRPWRTWVSVLVAVHLARTGGWNDAKGERGGRRRARA
jgi:DNA-3-methyladenine glycosylase II